MDTKEQWIGTLTRRETAMAAFARTRPEDTDLRRSGHALTPKQRDVLRLIAGGRSAMQTAAALRVCPRAVAYHKYRMMQQFHLPTTRALVQFALQLGMVA
ncbi:MAG TPA: LuxR C-terminal-related transcriptional regulator [Gemmatimonadaceae bacterium]|jgi:DNA-binding CsgD family transcriptional regulator|nr:LuxR C-terminal-related transcriptional regulator [Gemmatimonadaceae bacterium]